MLPIDLQFKIKFLLNGGSDHCLVLGPVTRHQSPRTLQDYLEKSAYDHAEIFHSLRGIPCASFVENVDQFRLVREAMTP